jgi:hypothetical protein
MLQSIIKMADAMEDALDDHDLLKNASEWDYKTAYRIKDFLTQFINGREQERGGHFDTE